MRINCAAVFVMWLLGGNSCANGQDYWNQFRGSNGDGVTISQQLPLQFSEGSKQIVWKTPIAGKAWSSPVVWKEQVWVTNAPEIQNPPGLSDFDAIPKTQPQPLEVPIKLTAICLDLATGKPIHEVTVFNVTQPQYTHQTNSYASPTPVIEAGRIYVHYGTYGTACLDTQTGEKLWERTDLNCHHWRGAGSSPIVHQQALYLSFDGYDKQFIVALDKQTGKTIWQRDRDVDFGTDNGDAKKAYSTPVILAVDGRDLLVSPHAAATTAYDAKTGEIVWVIYHGGMNAAARPLVGNGLVYINAGDGNDALIALDPRGTGILDQSSIKWRMGRMIPRRPSQLLSGNRFFMLEDKGVLACLDATNGDLIGSSRVSGNYWASPIMSGDRIYICSQDGKITIVKADPDFEVLATNRLDDGMIASPAVAGDSLIIRTYKNVYRIANPKD